LHCIHAKASVHFVGSHAYLQGIELITNELENCHEPDPRFP